MRLVLFRHGPAGTADPAQWADDGQRPLSARGRGKTELAAKGLARLLGDNLVAIWSSPLVRAAQTAAILEQACDGRGTLFIVPALAPGVADRVLLEGLTAEDPETTVVLVGHEPGLGSLAGAFVLGTGFALPMKKAGACAIDFDGPPRRRNGTLSWFLPPRVLRALAERKANS